MSHNLYIPSITIDIQILANARSYLSRITAFILTSAYMTYLSHSDVNLIKLVV